MKKKLAIFVLSQFLLAGWADAQQAYFIDGYHGGIYGHYPVGQTAFIAQKLRQNPNWNINIEIEPESWEVVRQRDPEGYEAFKRLFKDQSVESGRIEYVNPTYAQSYFFGTSGESAIRQFEYGIRLIRKHIAGNLLKRKSKVGCQFFCCHFLVDLRIILQYKCPCGNDSF